MIRFPEVNTCCFYASLRTGAKLFGFISLIGCFLLVILSAWEIVAVSKHAPKEFEETSTFLGIDIFIQAIHITASVFLLLGVYQERPKLVLPWLVTTVCVALLEILFLPSLYGRIVGAHLSPYDLDWFIITLFMLVDDVYGFIVVYSYYHTLSAPPSTES